MAEIIKMPKMSDTMTEGTIGKWLKKEGDPVKVGDIIAEIETDKATMEYESRDEGVLLKILVADGGRADCKTPIAVIGDKGEAFDESILTKQAPAKEKASDKKEKTKAEPEVIPSATPLPPAPPSGRIKSSPLARKLAHEKGIDLALISGSGPGGRIVRKDIEAAQKTGGEAWGFTRPGPIIRDERLPLSNMRRTIAKRLVESKTQMPHFYVEIEVDALPLSKLRTSLNAALEEQGQKIKLSVNDFILKGATEALRKVPVLNSAWEDDAVRQFGSVHMAFAVTLPTGLITPVIRDAQSKGIQSISKDAKALASKAKEGKLKPEDYTGGTFTVSNMGMMGITRFYPIINPPQAAILGVGAAINTPVVGPNGNVEAGQRMILTLSADHRVVDGSDAARFLNELKKLIETPALLLL